MAIKIPFIEVSGDYDDVTQILNLEVNEAYKQTCARMSIEVRGTGSFTLNDYITVDVGYDGSGDEIFQGFIDTIKITRRPGIYEITARDVLKRAIDHWIVTTDLENPWSRSNIAAEDLVRDLLNEAGITSYSGDASSFTFGVSSPAEFQIISSWDAIEKINNIIAWRTYARDGTVLFQNLWPVPEGAPVTTLAVQDAGQIESINHESSTTNLRNKVVVFGKEGIYAEASEESPYLPEGFYKTAIVSSEFIDSTQMAQDSADYNLELYNRLTESVRVDIEGDATLRARDTVTVIEPFTGINEDWFVYSITHRLDEGGFSSSLHLTK